uniref:Uncharacterized protein n=1 Tax=Ixodes ricinus TaxID=34613 RepID=A0A6B0UXJ4_IXORI
MGHHAARLQQGLQVGLLIVAHSNGTTEAFVVQKLELAPSGVQHLLAVGARRRTLRPMHHEHVQVVHPEPLQGTLKGRARRQASIVAGPQLGNQEEVFARNARFPDGLAQKLLAAVALCRVDEAIAALLQGVHHGRVAVATAMRGTQPQDRHPHAVPELDAFGGH